MPRPTLKTAAFTVLGLLFPLAVTAAPPPSSSPFQPPVVLDSPAGRYPEAMAAAGKEAVVVLAIDLDEAGAITAVSVAEPAGNGFDEAAIEAVKKFRFRPATRDGKPVAARLTWRYRFVLSDAPRAPAAAGSPTVPFNGHVKEKGTRDPIARAQVLIDESAITTTDEAGRFTFPAVSIGVHKIHVRASGFTPADTDETFHAGKSLDATYYVQRKQRYTTVVRGAKLVKQTLEQSLDIEEIKKIPGTQGDALKAVQTLPGVARAPFNAGQLIVWGSAPGDTRTYVDGVFIPTRYHFGGLRSTVSSELIQSLEFTPGGYGADYGRGLGGVVELDTRRPKTTGYHGDVDLNFIDGSLLIEGPITKTLSFEAAARRSWIDALLPLFTSNDFQLAPVYYDYQAGLHWKASPRDDVDLFIFGSDDAIKLELKNPDPNLSAQFAQHSFYHRALIRWVHRFLGGGVLTVTPSIGLDQPVDVNGQFGSVAFQVKAQTIQYNLRAVARIPVTSFLRLDGGLDFEGTHNSIDINSPLVGGGGGFMMGAPSFGSLTSDIGGIDVVNTAPYLTATFSLLDQRLLIVPGVRFELYSFIGYQGTPDAYSYSHIEVEPRLAIRYQFNPFIAIKAALGAYHQPPAPNQLLARFGTPSVAPETAYHYVLGLEIQPTPTLSIEASGFYKDMRSLIVPSSLQGQNFDNGGEGRVYGGELLVRQQLWNHFFGWLSYTVSRAERRDHPGEDWHLFSFDQTHILGLIASYELPRGFQVGVRFRYVTGNPTTPVSSWYWSANEDAYTPIYGALNSDRLEAFNELDIRFDKTFTYRLWRFSVYLDIQNVYNAKNPEALQYASRPVDCARPADCTATISGLPFFPALGVRGEY